MSNGGKKSIHICITRTHHLSSSSHFYRSRKIEHYDTRVLLERIKKGARIPHFIFFSAFFRFGERKKKNRPSVLSGFIYAHTGTKNRRNAHTHIGRMGAKKWWRNTLKIYVFSMYFRHWLYIYINRTISLN